ncbi:hypothetical protein Tco_0544243 [Tanacetum coccineum]
MAKTKTLGIVGSPGCSSEVTTPSSSSTPQFPEIAALADAVKALVLLRSRTPASMKVVEEICFTCGGPHPYYQCLAIDGSIFPEHRDNIQGYVSTAAVNYNQGNTGYRPQARWCSPYLLEKEPPPIDSTWDDLLYFSKRKNQTSSTPVKAVEESCVTCGGAHSYRNCPATDGNVYRDNIQEFVTQAAAANFNQGNTGYRAPIANQIRPPGFPPVQQNQGNNQNRYNQNRGNTYNQGQIYRPPINQPPVHQAPPYQAPAPQTQGVSKDDFQNYVKANDAVMRNMQNQNQNLQNQMTNLTDMLSKFVNSNTASTPGSGTLPSNTITNPKVDLKGITTRSGVAYQGPTIPTTTSPPKVVEREPEVTKDMVSPINNGSTKDVQPPVVQVENQKPNSEPAVAPFSALKPNPKPSIPYPSRRNDEKLREKANDKIEKFYKIF